MSIDPRRITLAPDGVFRTFQGEGWMFGSPMTFVRVAGCPVGCPGCDTDYSAGERLSVTSIVDRVLALPPAPVWLTGGEPTAQPVGRLVRHLREREGLKVYVATAGVREFDVDGWPVRACDGLSVSPHVVDDRFVVRGGTQVNLVFGLNGLTPEACETVSWTGFVHRWATPLAGGSPGDAAAWVDRRQAEGWRLGVQAHKTWGVR